MNKDTRFFLKDFENTELENSLRKLTSIISETEKETFSKHVELTRHVMELNKLFYVFRYNLTVLLDHFVIYSNNLIERRDIQLTEDQYYYQINALTINLISSAKTLTESIEVCMKAHLTKEVFNSFKSRVMSKPYDEHFSYRFLLHMRNYSQHGHLPINIHEQKAYFDIDDILSTPHFSLKSQLKQEIHEIKQDIYSQFGNFPHISYVHTIAKFNVVITEIYLNYLNEIKSILIKSVVDTNTLLKNSKFKLTNPDGSISDFIFYHFDGENYHCFNQNDNIMANYAHMKKEVKKILKQEIQYLDRIVIKTH